MSGMFNPDGTPDMAQIQNMTQEDVMNLIATQRASQGSQNPYAMMQQAMKMQQQKPQGQAPAPQMRRGQQANILAPLEELMKMQQMQQTRKRPQSLL
jgi:hypothetical protein